MTARSRNNPKPVPLRGLLSVLAYVVPSPVAIADVAAAVMTAAVVANPMVYRKRLVSTTSTDPKIG
jgi:hypothetical protein